MVALTDESGNIVATYEYDEWGNVLSKTGVIDTSFGYAGQFGYVYDKEIGLYFLTSRYYDPEIGRFTTRDRFMGFENRPASQNPYIYGENDPVNNVDPSGYWSIKTIFKKALPFQVKVAIVLTAAVAGGIAALVKHMRVQKNYTLKSSLTAFASGFALGLGLGILSVWDGVAAYGFVSAAASIMEYVIAQRISGKAINVGDTVKAGAKGFAIGAMFGFITKGSPYSTSKFVESFALGVMGGIIDRVW